MLKQLQSSRHDTDAKLWNETGPYKNVDMATGVPEDAHISVSQRWWSLCYILKHFSVLIDPRHNPTLNQISIPQVPTITHNGDLTLERYSTIPPFTP